MAHHAHAAAPRNTIETYSARPEREPPRNENGDIVCIHEACRDKNETFRRPCEWNKHMDKHERPYKCNEPTCEQNPGFTYSGGLLRHMREVHKKGVGPTRKPLYCPHANCIRSTGEGFTRRENLEEHLRRRHSYTGHYSPPPQSQSSQNEENADQPRKRRKTADPESPDGDQATFRNQQGDSRPDALRDLPPIDERLLANGDGNLERAEANRQLSLARQTIVEQQERIRQQDEQLLYLRNALQNIATSPSYAPRPQDGNLTLPVAPAIALAAQLQQEAHHYPDPEPQDPQLNGNGQVAGGAPGEATHSQDPDSPQKADKDAQANGSEPSRRIEIARDLISEKIASHAL